MQPLTEVEAARARVLIGQAMWEAGVWEQIASTPRTADGEPATVKTDPPGLHEEYPDVPTT